MSYTGEENIINVNSSDPTLEVKSATAGGTEKKDSVPIQGPGDVTIGVFFDGTLNNRYNTKRGAEWAIKHYDDDKITSYKNDYSNVAKLADLYQCNGDKQFAIYIEGIGTKKYGSDHLILGAGLGIGPTGVINRVWKACEKIVARTYTKQIDTLTFDVFGFSRGAAAARNFAYQVSHAMSGNNPETIAIVAPEGFLRFEYNKKQKKGPKRFKIRFLGLFDTVLSHGTKHQDGDTQTLNIKLDESKKATFTNEDGNRETITIIDNVLQLTAADEHRVNFALTDISSIEDGKNYKSFELPGVHSDIGGGYNNDNNTKEVFCQLTLLQDETVLEKYRKKLEEDGWYIYGELLVSPVDIEGVRLVRLLAERENIRNEYSLIPLDIMHSYAKEKGVPFNELKTKHKIPESTLSMQGLSDLDVNILQESKLLLKKAFQSGKLKVEWRNHKSLLKSLRHKFFHYSAHYVEGVVQPHKPRFNKDNGERERRIIKEEELNKDS